MVVGIAMIVLLSVMPKLPLQWGIPLGAVIYFGALLPMRGLTKDDPALVGDAIRGVIAR